MVLSQSILITGATGFVGSALIKRLLRGNIRPIAAVLAGEDASHLPAGIETIIMEPLSDTANYTTLLQGVDTVIHLAARVHVMDDSSSDALAEFRKVNVCGTLQLARAAVMSGVKRLVFISSVKVNGEESAISYTPDSLPEPTDPYGISKLEAEQSLRRIGAETGLEVVILRPPLVYGPGVKANFLNMMKIVSQGIPLPLATVRNARSLIYVGNLVDALAVCAAHPAAAGQTFLVSDGEDVSTPDLIRRTAQALGVPVRLFPVPLSLMRLAGSLTGKIPAVSRLTGSLTVDSSRIRQALGWQPPFTMEEGLKKTADWYLKVSKA